MLSTCRDTGTLFTLVGQRCRTHALVTLKILGHDLPTIHIPKHGTPYPFHQTGPGESWRFAPTKSPKNHLCFKAIFHSSTSSDLLKVIWNMFPGFYPIYLGNLLGIFESFWAIWSRHVFYCFLVHLLLFMLKSTIFHDASPVSRWLSPLLRVKHHMF